ncbi:MAG: hypothetical protein SFV32_13110 [Opitutaceae bacterium]|nr:hypothetical protein [Opitutaceae bacterium]
MSFFVLPVVVTASALASPSEVASLKAEVIERAKAISGRGDPDFSLQRQLDPLVRRLVEISRGVPVAERMHVLEGTWKQVWGPYNYRAQDRTVDPTLETSSIYQHVRADGSYFNACIVYEKGDRTRPRVSLLRGKLSPVPTNANQLRFQFTEYLKVVGERERQLGMPELAARFSRGEVKEARTVLPGWLVRVLSSEGILEEVYTDETLRLLYAFPAGAPERAHLYVMTRVTPASTPAVERPPLASGD